MHYRLAKLLRQAGKTDEARREVLKSLEEAPRFLDAHRLLLELVGPDKAAAPGTHPAVRRHHPEEARAMTRRRLILAAIPCLLAAVGGLALAQPDWPGRWRCRSPLDGLPDDRAGVPDWKVDEQFKNDVFTFVRVEYDSGYGGGGRGWRRGWGGGLDDRLARQRPELLLPPPAAHVAEGQPRPDHRCG